MSLFEKINVRFEINVKTKPMDRMDMASYKLFHDHFVLRAHDSLREEILVWSHLM
jgi:hypothetical protein